MTLHLRKSESRLKVPSVISLKSACFELRTSVDGAVRNLEPGGSVSGDDGKHCFIADLNSPQVQPEGCRAIVRHDDTTEARVTYSSSFIGSCIVDTKSDLRAELEFELCRMLVRD